MPPKKERTRYVCAACQHSSLKWAGRCPSCDAWNTMVEERFPAAQNHRASASRGVVRSIPLGSAEIGEEERKPLGEEELDRVLGGGLVPSSVILVGGEPGVGKSTLLLQAAALYAERYGDALYVSGEESMRQVALRAARLGLSSDKIRLLSETSVESVEEATLSERPSLVVVDSIQTMVCADVDSAPGSVSQVRECAHRLATLAKGEGVPLFLVGHVNKEGALAGPKVLEHAVDVVLTFEGEGHASLRTLRATKNRYGSTHEVGIFAMGQGGLVPVANPSELFLAERPVGSPGSVVIGSKEGSRPMLLEVQALVSPSHFGPTPRRQVSGVDPGRVAIILAVLERRVGLRLSTQDVYVNVVGGVKISEPAADLGIAVAVASSYTGRPLANDVIVFGEVGLAGEARSVAYAEERIKEARRVGFRRVVAPVSGDFAGVDVAEARSVGEALKKALGYRADASGSFGEAAR